MAIMIGVVYQKRALPIAWLVYKGKKGHASAERHIQAFEKLVPRVPEGSQVVLLGDAEYDTTEMLVWMKENTAWEYALRTSPQINVEEGQCQQAIRDYPLKKGGLFYRQEVGFTQTATVTLNLIGWWASRYDKPIFLITRRQSSITPVVIIVAAFALRLSSLTRKVEAFIFIKAIYPTLRVYHAY